MRSTSSSWARRYFSTPSLPVWDGQGSDAAPALDRAVLASAAGRAVRCATHAALANTPIAAVSPPRIVLAEASAIAERAKVGALLLRALGRRGLLRCRFSRR